MEIIDYLRARRDRVRLVLLIPLGAVALSLFVSLALPDRYVAELVVAVPAPTADYRAARVQAAEELAAALVDPSLRAEVPGAVGADLEVVQDGASITVSLRTTRPGADASRTVVALVTSGLEVLYAPPIAEAAAAADAAAQRSREAQSALRAFEEERRAPSASTRYSAVLEELAQLRRDREVALAAGDAALVDGLQGLIDERRAEKEGLEALLPDYRVVEREAAAASTQAETARGALDAAEARLAGVVDRLDELVDGPSVEGAGTEMLRRSLAAGAIGLLLAAGALAVAEVLRPPSAERAARQPAAPLDLGGILERAADDETTPAVPGSTSPAVRPELRSLAEPHPVP